MQNYGPGHLLEGEDGKDRRNGQTRDTTLQYLYTHVDATGIYGSSCIRSSLTDTAIFTDIIEMKKKKKKKKKKKNRSAFDCQLSKEPCSAVSALIGCLEILNGGSLRGICVNLRNQAGGGAKNLLREKSSLLA